jgi:hypothetical protein
MVKGTVRARQPEGMGLVCRCDASEPLASFIRVLNFKGDAVAFSLALLLLLCHLKQQSSAASGLPHPRPTTIQLLTAWNTIRLFESQ